MASRWNRCFNPEMNLMHAVADYCWVLQKYWHKFISFLKSQISPSAKTHTLTSLLQRRSCPISISTSCLRVLTHWKALWRKTKNKSLCHGETLRSSPVFWLVLPMRSGRYKADDGVLREIKQRGGFCDRQEFILSWLAARTCSSTPLITMQTIKAVWGAKRGTECDKIPKFQGLLKVFHAG